MQCSNERRPDLSRKVALMTLLTDITGMEKQMEQTICLILGPSGVGKSSFGEWLATERNWLHLEIDRFPEGDGVDLNTLRPEWDEFYLAGNAKRLGGAVQQRLEEISKTRAVLTFPGNLILSPDHVIAATQAGIRTIYLYGSAAHCISAFLSREQQTSRNLDLNHWTTHNRTSHQQMGDPALAPYRINVFMQDGTRRPHAEVFEMLLTGEQGD